MAKRIIALLVSVAIVVTSIPFLASADDSIYAEFNLFVKWNDGGAITMPVHNGSSINLSISDTEFHNFEISSIQFKKKPETSYPNLSFDIHFYYYPTAAQMFTANANIQNVNMDLTWYQCTLDPIPYGSFNYFSLGYAASLQTRFSTSDANRTVGSIIRLKASALPSNSTIIRVVIDNVHTNLQLNFVLNYIYEFQQLVTNSLASIRTILQSFYDKLFTFETWEVSNDYYDNGRFIAEEPELVTWQTAIYQLLKNLYAPVQQQQLQEQQAKDAGALDALDAGYDAAEDAGSFWDLLDFFHFSSFGDYDSDNVEAIGDNIGDWFTDRVQSELDNTLAPKSPRETISDYYSQNMDSISDLLGGAFD